jgi:hypothetical protein
MLLLIARCYQELLLRCENVDIKVTADVEGTQYSDLLYIPPSI